jgi:hypothetical protein
MTNHHDPDCPHFAERSAETVQQSDFADIFCDCHRYEQPHIFPNGTAIGWPKGWTAEMALGWREKKNLIKPSL